MRFATSLPDRPLVHTPHSPKRSHLIAAPRLQQWRMMTTSTPGTTLRRPQTSAPLHSTQSLSTALRPPSYCRHHCLHLPRRLSLSSPTSASGKSSTRPTRSAPSLTATGSRPPSHSSSSTTAPHSSGSLASHSHTPPPSQSPHPLIHTLPHTYSEVTTAPDELTLAELNRLVRCNVHVVHTACGFYPHSHTPSCTPFHHHTLQLLTHSPAITAITALTHSHTTH